MFKRLFRKIVSFSFIIRIINFKIALRYSVYFIKQYIFRMMIPGTALIAPTFKCQCGCKCCSAALFKKHYEIIAEMSFDDIKTRIKEIIKLGVPRIHFTGGEPLLYPNIKYLIKLCSDSGLLTFVETNGLLLDEGFILELKEAGVSSINISLDNADPDIHDKLRGIKGCYEKAVNAIRLAVNNKQNCMVSTYATKENILNGDLLKIIELARELHCGGVRIIAALPSGGWFNREDIILDKNNIEAVDNMLPVLFPVFNRTKLIKCPMKTGYKLFILPDGNIAPCEHLPFIFDGSDDLSLDKLVSKIKSYDMFCGEYFCMPRDKLFRDKYLDKCIACELPLLI